MAISVEAIEQCTQRPTFDRLTARALDLYTICSGKHHHTLKRRSTPADNELVRVSGSTIAARGVFIGREDYQTRAVAQVLFAA